MTPGAHLFEYRLYLLYLLPEVQKLIPRVRDVLPFEQPDQDQEERSGGNSDTLHAPTVRPRPAARQSERLFSGGALD